MQLWYRNPLKCFQNPLCSDYKFVRKISLSMGLLSEYTSLQIIDKISHNEENLKM